MSAPAPYSHSLDFCGVLSETKRIISAHSRHFLALSVFFLLPLSFSLIIYPTFQSSLSNPNSINYILRPRQSHLFYSFPTQSEESRIQALELLIPLVYALIVMFLSLCAVATITYSTFHGFYGRPVKLVSSIKSLFYSFLPLLSTLVIGHIIFAAISLLFGVLFAFALWVLQILGCEIDYGSPYFVGFFSSVAFALVLVLLWLQVHWSLGSVVVVVESKWGFEPLRRSAYLVKGMRRIAFWILFFYGLLIGFFAWGSSFPLMNAGSITGWRLSAIILQTVVSSGFTMLFMLNSVAANVVLYMYCKAFHGELAFEIAEEFAREYVSLPFDDEKVPHVVCVVQE